MKLLDSLPTEILTAEEEYALAAKIQRHKLEDDINRLVLLNMKEAFLYAKKVCRAQIADDELFSQCYTVLNRNAKRFNPQQFQKAKRLRFFAFAKVGIRGALSDYWKTLDVVKNSSMHETEVAVHVDLPRREDDEEDATKAIPNIPDVPVDPDFQSIEIREQMVLVNEAMKNCLTDQERMVIDLVYKDGFSFQDIANLLSITRSAVLLAHSKALKKIRIDMARQKRLLISK